MPIVAKVSWETVNHLQVSSHELKEGNVRRKRFQFPGRCLLITYRRDEYTGSHLTDQKRFKRGSESKRILATSVSEVQILMPSSLQLENVRQEPLLIDAR